MRQLSKIPEQTWLRVYRSDALTKQGGRCIYCKEPLRQFQATAEHVVPRAKGGSNDRINIKAACEPCNRLKGAMSRGQFMVFVRNPPQEHPLRFYFLMANFRWRLWRQVELSKRRILRAAGALDK